MRPVWIAAIGLLVGCGVKEDAFIDKFAERTCEWALECYDDASLEFLGWTDLDACIQDFGGRYLADVQGCTYDKKAAKDCLKAMKDATCPAEGEDPALPTVCEAVYDCGDGSTDDTGA